MKNLEISEFMFRYFTFCLKIDLPSRRITNEMKNTSGALFLFRLFFSFLGGTVLIFQD